MKFWHVLFLCALLLGTFTVSIVSSVDVSSTDSPLLLGRSAELSTASDASAPPQRWVEIASPPSLSQSFLGCPRFAEPSVSEPTSLAIARVKRMLSIDELWRDSDQQGGIIARRNQIHWETRRCGSAEASLLTLNIRLQV